MTGKREVCGQPRSDGKPCGYRSGPCPHHGEQSKRQPAEAAPGDDVTAPRRGYNRDKRERNLTDLGWWLIDEALEGNVTPAMLSSIGGIMRLLATLNDFDDEDSLREVELRGRLMHGLPPREEEEWALAHELFDDEAMAEFRRWQDEMDRDGPNPPGGHDGIEAR